MRQLFLIIAILLTASGGAAQTPALKFTTEKPDMEAIRAAVNDPSSKYYYPRLMKEYLHNDTLMKLDKFRHLYYGYMCQEDYDPYRPKAVADEIPDSETLPDLTRSECDSVIALCERALDDNPFDLNSIVTLIKAMRVKGKNNIANIWQYKLDYLLMTIASSGTGLDEEHAWHVVEPQHEYLLLNAMGLKAIKHLFYEPYYEYITVLDPGNGTERGYYFNIRTILEEYYRKHPEQK